MECGFPAKEACNIITSAGICQTPTPPTKSGPHNPKKKNRAKREILKKKIHASREFLKKFFAHDLTQKTFRSQPKSLKIFGRNVTPSSSWRLKMPLPHFLQNATPRCSRGWNAPPRCSRGQNTPSHISLEKRSQIFFARSARDIFRTLNRISS